MKKQSEEFSVLTDKSDREVIEAILYNSRVTLDELVEIRERLDKLDEWAKGIHAWINSTRKKFAYAAKVAGKLV